jgi:hypothetical protein
MRCVFLFLALALAHADDNCSDKSRSLAQDECALWQSLFDAWGGQNMTDCSDKRNDPCSCAAGDRSQWGAKFITCEGGSGNDDDAHITELHLPVSKLAGTIGDELKGFGELRWLGLHNNEFSGTIPGGIGDMSKLETLGLQRNMLSGSLPQQMAKLSALVFLELHGNSISGSVPDMSFANISEYCEMSVAEPGEPTNVFDCPLPPDVALCVPGPPRCKGPEAARAVS